MSAKIQTSFAPEAGIAEVHARVAHAVIRRNWLKWGFASGLPYPDFIALVRQELPLPYFGMLRSFIFFAECAVIEHESLAHWRARIVAACRAGHTWRRAVFPAYKSNRRKGYPPVSNTGVSSARAGSIESQATFASGADDNA